MKASNCSTGDKELSKSAPSCPRRILAPRDRFCTCLRARCGTMVINPPPTDNRCDCCGRHMSELKPFGGPGDPLGGDFRGALLVKTFRRLCGNEQVDASWECRDCIILDGPEYFNLRFDKEGKDEEDGD